MADVLVLRFARLEPLERRTLRHARVDRLPERLPSSRIFSYSTAVRRGARPCPCGSPGRIRAPSRCPSGRLGTSITSAAIALLAWLSVVVSLMRYPNFDAFVVLSSQRLPDLVSGFSPRGPRRSLVPRLTRYRQELRLAAAPLPGRQPDQAAAGRSPPPRHPRLPLPRRDHAYGRNPRPFASPSPTSPTALSPIGSASPTACGKITHGRLESDPEILPRTSLGSPG